MEISHWCEHIIILRNKFYLLFSPKYPERKLKTQHIDINKEAEGRDVGRWNFRIYAAY